MKTLWETLRPTRAGRIVRACVHAAYRVRNGVVKARNTKNIQSRVKKKYQSWRQTRYLAPMIQREHNLLLEARETFEPDFRNAGGSPLVSVIIPTWNRGDILAHRTIPSILNQTHQNFEVVIVGDCCTDNTGEMIKSVNDPRIRFMNLPERGKYPVNKQARWRVAGCVPRNKALELCKGTWIAPLDDDDMFTRDHIEILLRHAQNHNLEFVYGKLKMEIAPGVWQEKSTARHEENINPQNSTTLFRSYIKLFRADINAWRIGMSGDRQRARRYREAGVRMGFIDEVVAVMQFRPGQTQPGHNAEDRPDNTM